MEIFYALGIIIIVATVIGFFLRLLKQPLIPAYVLAGMLIGPVFGIIETSDIIHTFSEIGIAFLLFIVGLEIDIKKLKNVGMVAGLGGSIQIVLLALLGTSLSLLMGLSLNVSLFIGLIVAFSSTMVVVKLLSDKKELDTLHGRIVLGILLVEDIFAIAALFVLSAIGLNEALSTTLMRMGVMVAVVITGIFLLSRYILPKLFRFSARTQEMLFLSSLSICFLFSILFHQAGLSVAIGAFIAGLTLGNLPYNLEIIGRVRSIKDFFATLFFVALGMQLEFSGLANMALVLIVLLIFTIIIKPIVVYFTCLIFGYKRKVSFLSAISLAQISEFSLILAAVALSKNIITADIFSMITLLAIITISITSYLIKYDKETYDLFDAPLGIFHRFERDLHDLQYVPDGGNQKWDIVLCGYDRIGYGILKKLHLLNKKFLVIDYNPEVIKELMRKKISCIYGDISDLEIIERMELDQCNLLISTIPDDKISELLIKKAREANKDMIIFVTAYNVDDALCLYEQGASYVILPHFLGGDYISMFIEEMEGDLSKVINAKTKHIRELEERRNKKHRHPAFDDYIMLQ